jgi:hypothetical protein
MLDGPESESRWGAIFPATVQTGLQDHPAFYKMGTGSFPECRAPGGVALNTHSHLAPRLKKEYSYTSTPALDLHGLLYGELRSFLDIFHKTELIFDFLDFYCTAKYLWV